MMCTILKVARIFSNAIAGLVLAVVVLFALPSVVIAQTGGTGSIQGLVTDSSGAVIIGAHVQAANKLTNVATEAITNGDGHYVIPLLQPGPYKVVVNATNFASSTQANVTVDALAAIRIDVKLSISANVESVTVTGEEQGLSTQDEKLGSEISNETYAALPLIQNGQARDPSAFIGLAVGVNNFSTQAAGTSLASFNGGQTYQNETYIEGLPVTSAGTEGDTRPLAFGVSAEAVEQFQVAVTGSEATYEGQGVSNFILKSGTNKFHGGVYEFFRNTIFDAKPFFATSKPPEHQNEFGGNLGGPILHDKLFFFVDYDGYRLASVIPPATQSIPTIAERSGDFTAFLANTPAGCTTGAAGCVTTGQIFDPATCLATNSTGACISRQQFSCNGVLNVICPNRISKAAQSLESYLPTPTSSGISNNLSVFPRNQVTNDTYTAKVDYNLSAAHRLFGIFSRGKYANPVTGSLAQPSTTANAAFLPYLDGRSVLEYTMAAQVHEDWTIRPSLINDFGYGVNRLYVPLTSNTVSGNYPTKAGLTGLPPGVASEAFPDVNFSGNNTPVSWAGMNSHINTEAQTTFTAQDNILWTKGRHQVTFGFQWQALQDNYNNPTTGTLASFNFSPNETSNFVGGSAQSGAINPNSGLSYASYLLGAVDSSSVTSNSVAETGGRYKTNAAYVQDNIQVNTNLTVNIGLRWDVWTPFHETLDRQTFFNPNLANPVAGGILGALQFDGNHGPDSCGCGTPVLLHWKNFGPRFGFAYKIDNKTVIRGAYDIFYSHAGGVGGRGNGRQGLSQVGFNNSGSSSSTVTGEPILTSSNANNPTPYSWDSGIPGNVLTPPFFNPSYGIGFISASAPGAAAIGAGPGTAATLTYGDPKYGGQAPQYQDFFLDVQRAFGTKTTLSIAYSGSVGRHLPGAAVAGPFTDQIPLKYLDLGSDLTDAFPAGGGSVTAVQPGPYKGTVFAPPFPGFTGTLAQSLRPYPQYSSISDPWLDVGTSSYNSLQATLNRRVANGLTFMINYTYSKEEDNLAGVRVPGEDYLEYTVGALDRKHILQSTFVYKLPFGETQHFRPGNFLVKAIANDWTAAGVVQYGTGAPLSITATCTGGGIIDASCYPNINPSFTGSAVVSGHPTTITQAQTTSYLVNSAAFSSPAAYHYGNAARNAPLGAFAPHYGDIDANLRRDFPLFESVRFSFQADVFNILNRVYFAAPNTSITSASYGTYSNVQGVGTASRKFQFSGRITF